MKAPHLLAMSFTVILAIGCDDDAVYETRPEAYMVEHGEAIARHMTGEADREAAARVEAARKDMKRAERVNGFETLGVCI